VAVDGQHGCCCGRCDPALPAYLDRWSTARTTRQIAGHRRILARFNQARREMELGEILTSTFRAEMAGTLRASALALADVACAWSDHPDFCREWADFCELDSVAPTLRQLTELVQQEARDVAARANVPLDLIAWGAARS
jgi:hypothetical protein